MISPPAKVALWPSESDDELPDVWLGVVAGLVGVDVEVTVVGGVDTEFLPLEVLLEEEPQPAHTRPAIAPSAVALARTFISPRENHAHARSGNQA
jgi:hypothetical protein